MYPRNCTSVHHTGHGGHSSNPNYLALITLRNSVPQAVAILVSSSVLQKEYFSQVHSGVEGYWWLLTMVQK